MIIRAAVESDAAAIAAIYNYYIETSHATFEIEPVDANEIQRRIEEVRSHELPYLIAEVEGKIAGYAYGSPWKNRPAYRHSAEISVYVQPGQVTKGIGSSLYSRLIEDMRSRDIHTLIGGISLPNDASVRLHERFGFEKVAHFRQTGRKFDRWIDVGYWQLMFNSDRST